ncbi:hypothetical protein J5N97_009791 [Dioscorea zingiberensis]|uniref:Ubiquitin-like protease family profile domain-containing protein n=1 Tax=Dioscorea zingiberensis TaxID=325984 RepID=A0A9D5CXU5_9LILI|nr:hypothetical protein J5N97_009791 [Dioscorea zingiberensis]
MRLLEDLEACFDPHSHFVSVRPRATNDVPTDRSSIGRASSTPSELCSELVQLPVGGEFKRKLLLYIVGSIIRPTGNIQIPSSYLSLLDRLDGSIKLNWASYAFEGVLAEGDLGYLRAHADLWNVDTKRELGDMIHNSVDALREDIASITRWLDVMEQTMREYPARREGAAMPGAGTPDDHQPMEAYDVLQDHIELKGLGMWLRTLEIMSLFDNIVGPMANNDVRANRTVLSNDSPDIDLLVDQFASKPHFLGDISTVQQERHTYEKSTGFLILTTRWHLYASHMCVALIMDNFPIIRRGGILHVFVPVNDRNYHWFLVVIDMPTKKTYVVDSLPALDITPREAITQRLVGTIEAMCRRVAAANSQVYHSDWPHSWPLEQLPTKRQPNVNDYGLYIIAFQREWGKLLENPGTFALRRNYSKQVMSCLLVHKDNYERDTIIQASTQFNIERQRTKGIRKR